MAAGQGFKTFATGDVLTAADVNGYLMQGVLVFASAAARDAAITAPQAGQTAYLKDSNTIVSYSGSAWVVKSGASPLTTKGDLYTYSTTDARLAVGTDGQVLTAASGQATGLQWASPASGGMTLISTTTLTGASITLSSIPQTYNSLYVVIRNLLIATDGEALWLRFNGDSTASRHAIVDLTGVGSKTFTTAQISTFNTLDNAVTQSLMTMTFPDYTNTTTWKNCDIFGYGNDSTTTTTARWTWEKGLYNQTSAVSSLQFLPSSGNFTSGTVYLYGVK
jgi:hypothetical protein